MEELINYENKKYVVVEDDEYSADQVANLFNVPLEECIVIKEDVYKEVKDSDTGRFIFLRVADYGKFKVAEVKKNARFWGIPCWYYPETRILSGRNLFYSLLLEIARPLSDFISRFIAVFTGRVVLFKVRILKGG